MHVVERAQMRIALVRQGTHTLFQQLVGCPTTKPTQAARLGVSIHFSAARPAAGAAAPRLGFAVDLTP
jgi:hypothetical protein